MGGVAADGGNDLVIEVGNYVLRIFFQACLLQGTAQLLACRFYFLSRSVEGFIETRLEVAGIVLFCCQVPPP